MKLHNNYTATSLSLLLLLTTQLVDLCYGQKVGVASDTALACWSAASDYNFGCCINESLNRTMLSTYGTSSSLLTSLPSLNNTAVNTTVTTSDPTSMIRCQCMSVPFLQTFATCLRDRASTFSPVQEGYTFFFRQCFYNAEKVYTIGDLEEMYFNATNLLPTEEYCNTLEQNYSRNQSLYCNHSNRTHYMRKVVRSAALSQTLLTVPVNIDDEIFALKHRAACASKTQYRLGSVYGIIMLCYWGVAIAIASIYRFIQQMYPEILMANNPYVNMIRKSLVLPATFRRHRSRPVKLLMNWYICAPTRGQSLLLLGYFFLAILFLSINYDTYDDNPLLPGYRNQILKYMGSRTGIIAFTQLPLVIVFGSRNSPLIWSTGWSYDTFQIYHRWAARVMMLFAIIHSVCFIAISVIGNTWHFRWEHIINWRFGNLATYSGIIMVLTAVNRFRAKFYEYFFLIHKVFFILFMIGIFRHCWDFGWMPWVYAGITLYFSERLIRYARAFVSGCKNRAYAEVYPDGVVRLSVKYSKRWEVMPGQYCYVRFLRKDMFWQAHPFSVYRSADPDVTTLQFCIAPQKGATRQISDYLKAQPSKSALMPVMIEGPYGVHQDLDKYDTVMLVAGGLGITAIYSYAIHLKQYGLRYKGQKVVFMWIIANISALEWFSEELLSLMNDDRFEIQIYITRDLIKDSIHKITEYAADEDEDLVWPNDMSKSDHSIIRKEELHEDEKMEIYDSYHQQHNNRKSLPNRIKDRYMNRVSAILSPNSRKERNNNDGDFKMMSDAEAGISRPDSSEYNQNIPLEYPHGKMCHGSKSKSKSNNNSRNLTPVGSQASLRMVEIPLPPKGTSPLPSLSSPAHILPTSGPGGLSGAVKMNSGNSTPALHPSSSMSSLTTISSNSHNLRPTSSINASNYVQHNLYSNPEQMEESMAHVLPAQRIKSQFAHLMSDKRPDVNQEIAKCLSSTNGLSSAYSHQYNLPGEQEYWEKKMERKMEKEMKRKEITGRGENALHPNELNPVFTAASTAPLRSAGIPVKPIGKSLAIISCGPPALVDSIRSSIVAHLHESEGRVEYFEEAFSW